jgi:hypothetical protein
LRASAAGAPLSVVALAPGESARFDARGAVLSSPATTEEATA